ncbi:haloacid dehalogenase, partial [Candidatus Woesearchaeota archaeon]|nr:haloacid dehalogenase [Candidatus Woesearchaeota archaeon]
MISDELALFDIDGTLVKGFKAHNEAFSEAFRKVYQVDATVDTIAVQGMTEQQVIIEVLKQHGLNEK